MRLPARMPGTNRLSGLISAAARFARRVGDSIRWRIVDRVVADPVIAPCLSICARLIVRIHKPFIIGITGSVGKTTTTEMVAAVLTQPEAAMRLGRVARSSKNLNNDVGLPLAVLLFDEWFKGDGYRKLAGLCRVPFRAARLAFTRRYPDVLVLEYGTGWNGHIHRLAALAPPNIAVVTTVGPAHLERLKTLEGVAREKGGLARAVGPDGLVVLGDGHDFVSDLEQLSRAPVVKVSGRGADLSRNIARVIGRRLGISDAAIDSALAKVKPPQRRLNRMEAGGITIIDDTYNANPLSMRLGLDILAQTAAPARRRVAILGSMGELGDESRRYHEEIGRYARGRADLLIGVGDLARHYKPDHWFADSATCANQAGNFIRAGDCVFVKGSAAMKMIAVVTKLKEQAAGQLA
ncbi:MAG: UDP-N-acetylmuramoyl-tripeptide--D-alanyl-D-alanine ligase [Bryobacterales bacterium]|nr:UDP-N-acetylmuramoyl-tripeptide--D-alanyl-D-alanine ligase [Bryobacterales bacterium]